jgi:hypothetical protein
MGTEAIAAGDYLPDRHQSLAGAAAYHREKRKYMKDLGLARADDVITDRMRQYIRVLESGGDRIGFLRGQALKMKLLCPQAANVGWTPRQNGYTHYRIRPIVMFLYAIRSARLHGVEATTDDIALSAFRFFTPGEQQRVDETFLTNHIDAFYQRKAQASMDYEHEFRALMTRVERDLGQNLSRLDRHAFARKCRNAGNEVYCTIIFLRELALINTRRIEPQRWSCTQQRYEDTPPVPQFNILALAADAERALTETLTRVPVWHADLVHVFGQECYREIAIVNRLANCQSVGSDETTDAQIRGLEELGIELIGEDANYRPRRVPVFELQYDMP